jgi:phosphoribosylaminoimidazolecarboxamide formyltransferase/IMP cyclohydrolase
MAVNIVEQIDDAVQVRHVLASVSDKTGLDRLIPALLRINPEITIYSTGGTYAAIRDLLGRAATARLKQVSDYTGQPEMQGGLVKTLDFKIYLGLLSETYNTAHQADLARVQAVAIDMVVVNLYPFAGTIAKPGATVEQARANIDIGGPCMVRAAAKNFLRVASVTDPAGYDAIIAELERTGGRLSLQTRFELARQAFAHTAAYDTAIAQYLARQNAGDLPRVYRMTPPDRHV